MKLSVDQKETLLSILHRLRCRQKALAVEMTYATGNLSEFLNPDKNKGVEIETWDALVAGLRHLAELKRDLCQSDPSIMRDIELVSTWGRETVTGGGIERAKTHLYPPFGPLPLDAINYVKRRADDVIQEIIDYPASRSVLVRGGIGSGRTSWLNRLAKAAEDTGAMVVFLDEGFLEVMDRINPIGAIVARLAQATGIESLKTIAGNDDGLSPSEVAHSLMSALNVIDRPLYILCDDVEAWPQNLDKFASFADFVANLQLNVISSVGSPKRVIASAIPPSKWSTVHGSRLEAQSSVATLSFLTNEQVHELIVDYGQNFTPDHKSINYTSGHPRYTQILLWSCRHGGKLDEAVYKARLLDPESGWDSVASRLRDVFTSLSEKMGIEAPQLAKKLEKIATASTPPRLSDDEDAVLRSLGAIDGPRRQLVINCFFVDMASYWFETEETK